MGTVKRKCPWSQAQDPSLGKNRLGITNLEHELEAALIFFVSKMIEGGKLWEESYILHPQPHSGNLFSKKGRWRKQLREALLEAATVFK